MLRGYSVPAKIAAPEPVEEVTEDSADRFIKATPADIRHGGSRACFVPSLDIIQLPPRSAFIDDGNYRATTLHELGHWSGDEKRLNRDLKNRFGTQAYAAEELIGGHLTGFPFLPSS